MLRRTIAQRGALRPVLLVCGTGIWALILTSVLVWLPYPIATAIPLLILAATFEAIRPLHFGAERIGRYVQVFYEEAGEPGRSLRDTPSWERVTMSFGAVPGVGGNPLYIPIFFLAIAVNYGAILLSGPVAIDLAIMAAPHAVLVGWLIANQRAMKTQRAIELERLRNLSK